MKVLATDSRGDLRAPLGIAVMPVVSVAVASALQGLAWTVSGPVLPPLGYMTFIAWRLLRSDLWPAWIGLPLGAWDDLVTGQPLGSAMAIWTATGLALDISDVRLVWRDLLLDWIIAAVAVAAALIIGAVFARAGSMTEIFRLIAPQLFASIFILPAIMWIVARLDRWRIRR